MNFHSYLHELDMSYFKVKTYFLFVLMYLSLIFVSWGQGSFNLVNTNTDKIKFQLIDNLIIIPVSVNGVELSFIVDTGVSRPILFNMLNFSDSLKLKNLEIAPLRGLGTDGAVSAIRSKSNVLKVGKAINVNQELFVVFDDTINFTPILGVPVHGIIGYNLFKDFIIEVNYRRKVLTLFNKNTYKYKKCKNCYDFELEFYNNKPHMNASIQVEKEEIPIKLLIDTGGSDDLWLFEDDSLGIKPMRNAYFRDYLGRGLSGSVYGKRSKVEEIRLKDFKLEMVNTAFPDSIAVSLARSFKGRNGSISGGILRRFDLIFDYQDKKLTMKKNSNFDLPFEYNKSGIVLEQRGERVVRELVKSTMKDIYGRTNESSTTVSVATTYEIKLIPAYEVVVVRPNSAAYQAGIRVGDVVISINGKRTQYLNLEQVNKLFHLKAGSNIKMILYRNDKELTVQFKLEDLFQ